MYCQCQPEPFHPFPDVRLILARSEIRAGRWRARVALSRLLEKRPTPWGGIGLQDQNRSSAMAVTTAQAARMMAGAYSLSSACSPPRTATKRRLLAIEGATADAPTLFDRH